MEPTSNGKQKDVMPAEGSSVHRRPGKEMVAELGTEEEKKAIVISMAKARRVVRRRFLAVGIFLSMLTVTSKQLVDSMKKVWRIRGNVDTNPLPGKRFILEFSEEGDLNHVKRGGPWRYRDDAVIIEELKEGEDPMSVPFNKVPIWAQFRDIPFYLLSKELATDLGNKIGKLLFIDEYSRGDLFCKFIRARVELPINRELQRWTMLYDEFKGEDVAASVYYERLPNYCTSCGFIGHQARQCTRVAAPRRPMYVDLGVQAWDLMDPRRWDLPEVIGAGTEEHEEPEPEPRHQAIVKFVASGVERLTIKENKAIEGDAGTSTTPTATPTTEAKKPTTQENKASEATTSPPQRALAAKGGVVVNAAPTTTMAVATVATAATDPGIGKIAPAPITYKRGSWKRIQREEEEVQSKTQNMRATQSSVLGATRVRHDVEDAAEHEPPTKKYTMFVPSLEESLGADVLRELREQENNVKGKGVVTVGRCVSEGSSESLFIGLGDNDSQHVKAVEVGTEGSSAVDGKMRDSNTTEEVAAEPEQQDEAHAVGEDAGLEATGQGAAGKLSGAKVGAWQAQC
jgi:hypothetical protein